MEIVDILGKTGPGSEIPQRALGAVIGRRQVLLAIGGVALCQASDGAAAPAREPEFPVPLGSCDCHVHVYDPRFPYLPNARLKPGDASLGDYRREVQAVLRTTRATFVTPSTYGTDNRCLTGALARCGKDARGVAVVDPG